MKTATERLLEKARFDNGCLIWQGALSDGYGMIWYEGKLIRAHRLAWLLSYGVIPKGIQVLHKCDNRRCIRLDHLFLGTQADNLQDAINKGHLNLVEAGKRTNHPSRYKGWHWKNINNKRVWILPVTATQKGDL